MTIPTIPATNHVDKINQAEGYTIDQDGLTNSYAIEPEMYEQDGSMPQDLGDKVTVIDIFNSKLEAKNAVLEIEQKGLTSARVSIIAKDYQDAKSSLKWDTINAEGGLATVLGKLGISEQAIGQFVEAIADGKYLIIVTGSDREASQTQHVLEEFGHRVIILE